MKDVEYSYLKRTVLAQTGIDLDSYKSQQMRRRLEGFIESSPSPDVMEYCKALVRDGEALRRLRDHLTINVSEFFRDREHFRKLQTVVLPELLKQRPRLNIWSAGCSHGEEPYTIAMILDGLSPGRTHRILGTDIDEGALARAREGGPYRPSDVSNVEEALLSRYFTSFGEGYRLTDRIKSKVEFRQQNLLSEGFESGFDLILCRNVVIYFTDKAKAQLVQGFYQSLREGGVLFTGASETLVPTPDPRFQRLEVTLYKKQPVADTRRASRTAHVPSRV